MDRYAAVTSTVLLDMAAFLVRDNDRTDRYARQVENLPKMHAKYLGVMEGHRNALAMISGFLGDRDVDSLIARVRQARPDVCGRTAPALAVVVNHEPPDVPPGLTSADMRELDPPDWPVDHAEGE